MKALRWTVSLCLLSLLAGRALAVPAPQVLDNFATPAPDGRPAGWDLVTIGAEAEVKQVAGDKRVMRISYRLTQADGVVVALCRLRLRQKPWNFELTARCDGGGQVVGLLVRDGVSGQLYECKADSPLKETGWAIRAITPTFLKDGKEAKVDTLEGGGGLRVEGLTIRQGPGGKDQGALDFSNLVANHELNPKQVGMIDIIPGRLDGLFVGDETPKPELIVNGISNEAVNATIEYQVTDAGERNVGRGNTTVKTSSGEATRLPVEFNPPEPFGYYTVRASVSAGGGKRYATARFARLPAVPDAGRLVGVTVRAPEVRNDAWYDLQMYRMLQRAGVACVRYELRWAEVEPQQGQRNWAPFDRVLQLAKQVGLPVVVSACDPPGWALAGGLGAVGTGFIAFVGEAAQHGGDQVMGWDFWRAPNVGRFWPPEPQPFAYRALLDRLARTVRGGGRKTEVANGGLLGFERGFAAVLVYGDTPGIDHLGLAVTRSRHAFPHLTGDQRPSEQMLKSLRAYREWATATQRPFPAPWLSGAAVRTSAVSESLSGQAVELARCAALARGYGGLLFWNEALDGTDPNERYGLIRRNLEAKPGLVAIAGITALTAGAKPVGSAKSANPVLVMTGPQGFVGVGWGSGFRAPEGCNSYNLWGSPNGAVAGDAPVIFTGAAAVKALAGR